MPEADRSTTKGMDVDRAATAECLILEPSAKVQLTKTDPSPFGRAHQRPVEPTDNLMGRAVHFDLEPTGGPRLSAVRWGKA